MSGAVNLASFATVDQAVAAVAADAEAMGAELTSLAPERGLQRWHGEATGQGYVDRISWIVDGDPSPTVIRVVCSMASQVYPGSRCQTEAIDRMAATIAQQKSVPSALTPAIAAALPTSPAGLAPVLAVSAPSQAVWAGLQPTAELERAVRKTTSTVIQYAPNRASKAAVHVVITPMPKPSDARRFVAAICGGTPPGRKCTKKTVTKTASGQTVFGSIATYQEGTKVTAVAAQATGNGLLAWAVCQDLQGGAPLSTADAKMCQSAVPALLDAAIRTGRS